VPPQANRGRLCSRVSQKGAERATTGLYAKTLRRGIEWLVSSCGAAACCQSPAPNFAKRRAASLQANQAGMFWFGKTRCPCRCRRPGDWHRPFFRRLIVVRPADVAWLRRSIATASAPCLARLGLLRLAGKVGTRGLGVMGAPVRAPGNRMGVHRRVNRPPSVASGSRYSSGSVVKSSG
jgi:hypothetical protein